jgi:hypothetical protein
MGRRKKENNFSYVDIIVSTYITKKDYEKAQLNFSNNLSIIGEQCYTAKKTNKKSPNFIVEIEENDDDDDDDIY